MVPARRTAHCRTDAGHRRRSCADRGRSGGATLAWVNFRWLEQALEAMARLARAQSGTPEPRISIWVWIKVFSRYGLIGVLLYTAWVLLHIPVVSMLAGLCALGAAVMAEGIYEVIGRPA